MVKISFPVCLLLWLAGKLNATPSSLQTINKILTVPCITHSPLHSGPAGLFAALAIASAGLKVVLLERGQPVEQRGRGKIVNPEH